MGTIHISIGRIHSMGTIDGYYMLLSIYKCHGYLQMPGNYSSRMLEAVCSIGLPLFGDLTPFFVASCAMDVASAYASRGSPGVGAPNRSDHGFLHFGGDPPVI